jgi:hypothetical protein
MKEMMAANQAKADANLKEIKEERIADWEDMKEMLARVDAKGKDECKSERKNWIWPSRNEIYS